MHMHTCDAGRGAGREAGGCVRRRRRKRHARGRPDSRREGQGTRGAHDEHAVHVRDFGGVKAQRLVEGVRVLPSRRERHAMRGEVRAGMREGVGWRRRKRHARGKADSRLLGARARAERTPNILRMLVTLEVSQLEMSALKFFKLLKR